MTRTAGSWGQRGSVSASVVRALVMVVLTAGSVSCGSAEVSGTSAGSTTTTSVTTPTTVASTTTTATPVDDEIFGWLRSFESESGTATVGIDKAEMLSGEEALAAARKDGAIGPNEDLANDFYISNPDESIAVFTVSPDAVVLLQACFEQGECVTTAEVDLATWSLLLGGEDDPGLPWTWYGAGGLPYVFTVSGDVVVAVEEFYLP